MEASCTSSDLPNLPLEEAHVQVEVGVPDSKECNRLHPCPPLGLAHHWNLLEATETKQLPMLEVAMDRGRRYWSDRPMVTHLAKYEGICALFACPHPPPSRLLPLPPLCPSPHMKSLGTLCSPLAMDLNSTPSRLTSGGYRHSTKLPGAEKYKLSLSATVLGD